MLYYAQNFGPRPAIEVWNVTLEKLVLALPQPVLDALKIKIDKWRNTYSMGDYYRYLNEGEGALGGFATGSNGADMYSLFGVVALCTVALLLLVFLAFDSLSLKGNLYSISPVVLGSTFIILSTGWGPSRWRPSWPS